ncbi:MAG: D-2-hydroxyacid dehydrogenase [Muribaculaceae bacterium]|nr:D-2-hydroxyacid dehydrogenase [Muribaculaceae bacterium]
MKITVLDGYGLNPGDLSWEGMARLGDLTVYDRTPAELTFERSKDSEILLTNKTVIDGKTIEKLPKLKYIGVLATGYNIVDTETARKHGITVTNIPAYSTMSVAQMVFALILAVTNRVEHYTEENRNGKWSRNPDFCYWDTKLTEISGKTIGIAGLGHIGKAVAGIALAFGMKVLAYTSKSQEELPDGIKKCDLATLFADSDIVTLHCPLTPDTRHMANKERIATMKQGAILINTARGPLVDDRAVADALAEGKLRAFGADVMTTEPPAADNPLLSTPNAYITPHVAWATEEARRRLMQIATDNLAAFIEGRRVNII